MPVFVWLNSKSKDGVTYVDVTTGTAVPPKTAYDVLRVEKSDVEKRIEGLRDDVKSLHTGVESLRSKLDGLQKQLKELSETLRKN